MVRAQKQRDSGKDKDKDKDKQGQQVVNIAQHIAPNSHSEKNRESASKVLKYLDDYRSTNDTKALKEEGYEIDYDRLVGVGANSAVFLSHSINAPPPQPDKNGQRPLYTPGYDIAVKVVAKKWINTKRPSKTRTGNLKLALALGQTRPENNILKVIDVFKTPERIFIFMQYCAYGNIISFIRRNGQVPSRLTQRWSGQMASALCFLHKFHVAHRNYKLENVLIEENLNAKLTGFGLSKFCIDLQTKQPILSKTICGSEPYLAPEMLKESAIRCYDPKQADVWAFGVGVFLCSTRKYPFEADSLRGLKIEQLARRYLERDTKRRLRAPVRELLNSIFTLDPNQRPTMQDLCNQSAWLNASPQGGPKSPAMGQHASQPQHQQQQLAAHKSGKAESAGKQPVSPPQQQAQHQRLAAPQLHKQDSKQHQPTQAPNVEEPTLEQHLSPVTPVAVQPSDALPVVRSETDAQKYSRIN